MKTKKIKTIYEGFEHKYDLCHETESCPRCGYNKTIVHFILVPCSEYWIWEQCGKYCARCFKRLPSFIKKSKKSKSKSD